MTIIQRSDVPVEVQGQSSAMDPVLRFVRGEISRKQAMISLGGIGYGALIDQVAERGLQLPSLSDVELDRMADDLIRLLDTPA
jgi:hypothetical protein